MTLRENKTIQDLTEWLVCQDIVSLSDITNIYTTHYNIWYKSKNKALSHGYKLKPANDIANYSLQASITRSLEDVLLT